MNEVSAESLRALAASRPWTADEQGNWIRDTIDALCAAADALEAAEAKLARIAEIDTDQPTRDRIDAILNDTEGDNR